MNIFQVSWDPEAHRASCVMRYRLRAAAAMIFSAAVSLASWREIGRPFPGPSDGFVVNAGIPAFAAVAVYLFVTTKCVLERLWLGPVAAAIVIEAVETFGPRLVSQDIGPLRIASLALWLWSFLASTIFVVSAFERSRARQGAELSAVPSGIKIWKSFISKRPLILLACYLAAAVALDWGDLYHRHVAHPWDILTVDAFFEIFLCAWAAVLTEMVIRLVTGHSKASPNPPGLAKGRQ